MTLDRRFVPQRDLERTGFTAHLHGMAGEVPGLLAIAFCDEEGEIIDYHTYLDPFDTKLLGAVLGVLLSTVQREGPRLSAGGIRELVLLTDRYLVFARRTAAEYFLAGLMAPDAVLGKLLEALDRLEARLLGEAGI